MSGSAAAHSARDGLLHQKHADRKGMFLCAGAAACARASAAPHIATYGLLHQNLYTRREHFYGQVPKLVPEDQLPLALPCFINIIYNIWDMYENASVCRCPSLYQRISSPSLCQRWSTSKTFTFVRGYFTVQVPELVPEDQLPLTLPETDDFLPDGSARSPLAKIQDWLEFTDPVSGKRYVRETSTMPQWAGSCWCVLSIFFLLHTCIAVLLCCMYLTR
jgi:hypothetical protein